MLKREASGLGRERDTEKKGGGRRRMMSPGGINRRGEGTK